MRASGTIVALIGLSLTALAHAQPAPATGTPPQARTAPAQSAQASADKGEQPSLFDDKEAIEAGKKWLALIDTGKEGAAWDNSAAYLKSQVTRAIWIAGLRDARKPFGKVASREAVKFARAHEMPGAPEGDYAIIEFDTKFANGKRATEHLVWMVEPNDIWHVSGYYIR